MTANNSVNMSLQPENFIGLASSKIYYSQSSLTQFITAWDGEGLEWQKSGLYTPNKK